MQGAIPAFLRKWMLTFALAGGFFSVQAQDSLRMEVGSPFDISGSFVRITFTTDWI